MTTVHFPVLCAEMLEGLAIKPDGTYIDATAGLGGHSGQIAKRLDGGGRLYSCDRDAESLEMAKASCAENAAESFDRIEFVHTPFSRLKERLAALQAAKAQGFVADLGVSRMQLTTPDRGFSFMSDGPLDMRMDRSEGETAADIVNFTPEKELADLIYKYGEERRSRHIARAIMRARPIRTTKHLADVIQSAAPRMGKIHSATLSFQALRIVVNGELDEIESLLAVIPDLMQSGGRVAMISFHSLEDRLLKKQFQQWAREGKAKILTKHVMKPTAAEINANAASRSAKLRLVEMT